MKKLQNILITGANGQLGICLRDVVQNLQNGNGYGNGNGNGRDAQLCVSTVFFTDIEELDITDISAVSSFVHKNKIDCIINTAAYTAVDKAETEPEKAFMVNGEGVWILSHVCMEQNVFLIHISTDYVFDGAETRPYKTNAHTNPVSVYGRTKLAGERFVLESQIPSVIIRTSWLYSQYGHNFMNTMLRLGKEKTTLNVVDDQFGAPTNAHDLAAAILQIVEQAEKISKPTIFHYANEGVTTWCGFAQEIMKIAQLTCVVQPISTAQYPTPAARPAYSVFHLSKIKTKFNIKIPNWVESLQKEIDLKLKSCR